MRLCKPPVVHCKLAQIDFFLMIQMGNTLSLGSNACGRSCVRFSLMHYLLAASFHQYGHPRSIGNSETLHVYQVSYCANLASAFFSISRLPIGNWCVALVLPHWIFKERRESQAVPHLLSLLLPSQVSNSSYLYIWWSQETQVEKRRKDQLFTCKACYSSKSDSWGIWLWMANCTQRGRDGVSLPKWGWHHWCNPYRWCWHIHLQSAYSDSESILNSSPWQ